MTPLIIGFIILALLALVVVGASFRRRDTSSAIGQLSSETVKRDRSLVTVGAEGEEEQSVAVTGTSVEAAARVNPAGTSIVPEVEQPPVVYVPPDPETIGVNRRQFLNRAIIGSFGFALTVFGLAVLAQLWPRPTEGFGARLSVGRVGDLRDQIRAGNGFLYFPQGRMWLTEYPEAALAKAPSSYTFFPQVQEGLEAGISALFQTCPHLGCRVPECVTSQWFECPCHGSQYNQAGEKKGGPAPRGMDRFPMTVTAGDVLVVDTGTIIDGPAIGVNTTGQEAEGPNCLSNSGGH